MLHALQLRVPPLAFQLLLAQVVHPLALQPVALLPAADLQDVLQLGLLPVGFALGDLVLPLQVQHPTLEALRLLVDGPALAPAVLQPVSQADELLVDHDAVDRREQHALGSLRLHTINYYNHPTKLPASTSCGLLQSASLCLSHPIITICSLTRRSLTSEVFSDFSGN